MNDKAIVEAMARLDGRDYSEYWEQDGVWWAAIDGNIGRFRLPAYLTSHDACQRVIDGLGRDQDYDETYGELGKYQFYLTHICGSYRHTMISTPRQKCEAILKAKGVWEK